MSQKYSGTSTYNFALNSPIWAMDPDGSVVIFSNKKSEKTFNRLYTASSDETKAKLNVLKSSDVVYNINTRAIVFGRNASTQYNFDRKQVDILLDKDRTKNNPIGSLADELAHALQFEQGRLGFVKNKSGSIGTLGYDMGDEVESMRANYKATNLVNAYEGINLPLSNTIKAFLAADNAPGDHTTNIEGYFNADPSAKQYLNIFDTRGKKMGVNISGSGNYTKEQLDNFIGNGSIENYIYREKQSDGTNKTVTGQ
jgi:hypothetical protein